MRAFNRLPTDRSVREMSEGDFLFCYLGLLMDEEGDEWEERAVNADFERAVREESVQHGAL